MILRIILTVTVVISGITSYVLASDFYAREAKLELLPWQLKPGENKFNLMFDNVCFGKLNLNFAVAEEVDLSKKNAKLNLERTGTATSITVAGEAKLYILTEKIISKLTGELEFSELNHLGASIFRVKFGDIDLGFGTRNIDPIELIAWYRLNDVKRTFQKYNYIIPGPIELIKKSNNLYNLKYRLFRISQDLSNQGSTIPSLKKFTMVKSDILGQGIQCDTFLDTTQLISELVQAAARMNLSGSILSNIIK